MTFSLIEIFFIYLAVFLALICTSWFVFSWRRHRSELRARRSFICSVCAGSMRETGPSLRLRCPDCGAVLERRLLKEK